MIDLVKYRITYHPEAAGENPVPVHALPASPAGVMHDDGDDEKSLGVLGAPTTFEQIATVKVLNGESAGQEFNLDKITTIIGRPGVQVAAITLRAQGYYVSHLDGDVRPLVNGVSTAAGEFRVVHGDVIDMCGTRMAFCLG